MKTKTSSNRGGARREGRERKKGFCVFFPLFFQIISRVLDFCAANEPIERCCRAGQGRTITSIIILYDDGNGDGDDDADEADDEDDDDDIARYRCNCWHFDAENRVFYTKTLDHA